MGSTRTALAAAAALLTLAGLATTAHADDHGRDHGENVCFIRVEGSHNHNACGSIKYGDNATTGSGQAVALRGLASPSCTTRPTLGIVAISGAAQAATFLSATPSSLLVPPASTDPLGNAPATLTFDNGNCTGATGFIEYVNENDHWVFPVSITPQGVISAGTCETGSGTTCSQVGGSVFLSGPQG
ncbi:hypothetical protein ACTVZO_23520 [Streptomyces sp. IBSNAI002]|uniref:hypothetical protein n=1 Tax=Streptomyces sp. IBSNAI002 TaxID=3457500 RepID=UPI003FD0F645